MTEPSIDDDATDFLDALAADAGFAARGFAEGPGGDFLAVALAYGNDDPDSRADSAAPSAAPAAAPGTRGAASVAAFARRDYYREAVERLRGILSRFRAERGGSRSDFRILCNSPVPEKPLAVAAGIARIGRNCLAATEAAGSLVVLAAVRLSFNVPEGFFGRPGGGAAARGSSSGDPCAAACGSCRLCVDACPTGALRGDGAMDRERCLQWHASRPGEIPGFIRDAWGARLYGCEACIRCCPKNRRPIVGASCARGALPAAADAEALASMADEELRAAFKGSAMGMSWLGPAAIRRNAVLALGGRP